jgi:pimeloyl-ACP methyl ester carboxylesterase
MHLHHRVYGSGPEPLLAFHGVGQDGSVFRWLVDKLDRRFTIYAFDLPFHGQSTGPVRVLKPEWRTFLETFLTEHRILRCSVIGYSLGCRLALATLEAIPERLNATYLLAPESLSEHPLFRLATGTPPGRWLFRRVVSRSTSFERLANLLERRKWIHPSLTRQARWHVGTPVQQQRVLGSWLALRELRYSPAWLGRWLTTHPVPTTVFVGTQDRIFPPKKALPLSGRASNVSVVELPSTHGQLLRDTADWLARR